MAQVTLPYTLTAGTPENVNNLMSNLTALRDGVNTIDTAQIANDAVTAAKIKDGEVGSAELATAVKTGLATNVQSTTLTTATSTTITTAQTFYDVSGLSVSITPTSSSSKVLVMGHMHIANGTTDQLMVARIARGSTAVGVGTSAGSRTAGTVGVYYGFTNNNIQYPIPFSYLDSPSTTSATTYKIQVTGNSNGGIIYTNRAGSDSDDSGKFRPVSTITVIEVL